MSNFLINILDANLQIEKTVNMTQNHGEYTDQVIIKGEHNLNLIKTWNMFDKLNPPDQHLVPKTHEMKPSQFSLN